MNTKHNLDDERLVQFLSFIELENNIQKKTEEPISKIHNSFYYYIINFYRNILCIC